MAVWQDAGRPILKNQQCVWEPSPLHPRQLCYFCPFLSRCSRQLRPCEGCVAVCDKMGFSSNQFLLLTNPFEVSCASGNGLKQPLNQLCCSFAELVVNTVLLVSSVVDGNDDTASMQNSGKAKVGRLSFVGGDGGWRSRLRS